MNLKRLQKKLNNCFRVGNKIETISTIKTFVSQNTNNNLTLFIAKEIIDFHWYKEGRISVGNRIIKTLKDKGYLENNNIK